jgi:hypothetical protein
MIAGFSCKGSENMFYDGNRILTYNALFNFIIGPRGLGKTFWSKSWAIRDFIKSDGQFVWVRRYKDELNQKDNNKFFNDLTGFFPEHKLSVDGSGYSIDGRPAGFAIPLSVSKIKKSVPYPKVNKIIFDEFLIDKGTYRYLPDEVTHFLELYETIARLRDVRVFFLSNAISVTNPYFLYFDLELPKGKSRIWRKGDILVELAADNDFMAAKNKTRFGQIIKDTAYGNYAIGNRFLRDSDVFICRKTEGSRYLFGFKYDARTFGVWVDYQAGRMTVSEDHDPSCPLVYTITQADHAPNALLIQQQGKSSLFKLFLDCYEQGNVYFENMQIKNICYQVFKLFHIR